MELDDQIKWHKAPKKWKPNLIQKLLIKLKIIKDKRYNGKKVNYCLLDEAGHWQDPNLDYGNYWKSIKPKPMKYKFYYATGDNLIEIVRTLEEKEYFQLMDGGTELTHLIINTDLKQFWSVDKKNFESNANIIKDKHGEDLHELTPKEIEKL